MCLQEVQADHFESNIYPFMVDLGYEGVFKQKSRESMGQYGKVDGCATFWKTDSFQLLEDQSFELNNCANTMIQNLNLDKNTSRKLLSKLNKDNIAQVLILDSLHSHNTLLNNMSPGNDNEFVASLNSAKVCVCVVDYVLLYHKKIIIYIHISTYIYLYRFVL